MAIVLSLDLVPKESDFRTALPVIFTITFYMLYWFISQSGRVRSFFYQRSEHDSAAVKHFFFVKMLGFVLLGFIPLVLFLILLPEYSIASLGLTVKSENISFSVWSALGLMVLAVISGWLAARKARNFDRFPQIRAKDWTNTTLIVYIAGWAFYLLGYEVLFRGILLMPLADHLGIWPAIAINIALYSAAHLPQGPIEAWGAAPVGLILCLVTLASGTIWVAFFVHLTMALTNSLTTMALHPDISYRRR
ncbi:MAG: CPBP family intramembrane metalloprotease [Bacteroidales bacterium]|nr:CPBP family intramembrane metalloprotease [Bacteroidales bacterium]